MRLAYIPFILFLLSALATAQTEGVFKNRQTKALTDSIVVPTGKSITINSGATITNNGTATGFGGTPTSVGGNGTPDVGKAAVFDSVDGYDGSLAATSMFYLNSDTGAAHGHLQVTDTGSTFTLTDNSIKSWSLTSLLSSLTDNRTVTAQDKDGAVALLTNHLGEFATTTSAQLRAKISDVSGSGLILTTTGSGASLTDLTKSQVGLANADNTSDANKPVSTATQTALDAKEDKPTGTIQTPSVLPQFWFDAYSITSGTTEQPQPGAAVASWRDIASNLNTVPAQGTGANQPTFQLNEQTRLPCVRFDGGDYLSRTNLSVSATSGHTVIVVQRCTGVSAMSQQCFFAGGDTSWFAWSANHSASRIDVAGQSGSGFNLANPAFDKIAVMAYRVKASPVGGMVSRREYWVGQTRIAQQDSASLAIPTTLQFSHLGAYINGTLGFTGDLFEIIGFASPLSDAQLTAIVAQLETKWKCQHNILCLDGNSLVSGSSGSNGLHIQLQAALGPGWYIKNVAVSGQTTAQRHSAFTTSLAPLLGPRLDGRKNLLFFHEFRNHLGATGVSYATAWAEFQSYLTDATTVGAQAVATTMIPASAGMPTNNWNETNRVAGNADIRATYPAAQLFDLDAMYDASQIQSDGIHYNAGIGEPAVAAAFVAWMKTNSFFR